MKDNFDIQSFIDRIDKLECDIVERPTYPMVERIAYDIMRDPYQQDRWFSAEQGATLDARVEELHYELTLLRKAIQDSLLYNPDDLRYDDII